MYSTKERILKKKKKITAILRAPLNWDLDIVKESPDLVNCCRH